MRGHKNSYEGFKPLTVKTVKAGSIGDELGIETGDRVISINHHDHPDELDYYYFTSLDEFTLEILKPDGLVWEIGVEKDEDEDLGLEFYTSLTSKECTNNCIFCFIDQLPPGMRETLYVKDDDERLSFLHGNYVTLTNLTEREIERICTWKIPLNISVHTTDEKLRIRMLANKRAGEINTLLKRFYQSHVGMNAQIVLVPEVNDTALEKTLVDLSQYYPWMQSVSVVPAGITRHREKLYPLRQYSRKEAREIIIRVERLQNDFLNKFGSPFVYLSDEFYLLAELDLPGSDHYGQFSQLENGVGMITNFREEFIKSLDLFDSSKVASERFLLVTGELFYNTLTNLLEKLREAYPEISAEAVAIANTFFGTTIGCAGLLTGKDIIEQLKNRDDYDVLVLPDTLLKNDTNLLLDDMSIEEIKRRIGKEIRVVRNDGQDLVSVFFE